MFPAFVCCRELAVHCGSSLCARQCLSAFLITFCALAMAFVGQSQCPKRPIIQELNMKAGQYPSPFYCTRHFTSPLPGPPTPPHRCEKSRPLNLSLKTRATRNKIQETQASKGSFPDTCVGAPRRTDFKSKCRTAGGIPRCRLEHQEG